MDRQFHRAGFAAGVVATVLGFYVLYWCVELLFWGVGAWFRWNESRAWHSSWVCPDDDEAVGVRLPYDFHPEADHEPGTLPECSDCVVWQLEKDAYELQHPPIEVAE